MRTVQLLPFFLLWAPFQSLCAEDQLKSARPLASAHAHNDYEHERPLLDALQHGFCSVEADIYLVNDQLLVAHDLDKVTPERTLQRLYLDPLRERTKKLGGRIYPDGPSFVLLIDIKSDGDVTYAALREVLKNYSGILTAFYPDRTETNAVTVIISGNRPRDLMLSEPARLAAYDGRLSDLGSGLSAHFMPLISDNWRSLFSWRGQGAFPEEERAKLKELVRKAHEEERKIRFWAAPDQLAVWKELLEAGVDFINTDDLGGLNKFLMEKGLCAVE